MIAHRGRPSEWRVPTPTAPRRRHRGRGAAGGHCPRVGGGDGAAVRRGRPARRRHGTRRHCPHHELRRRVRYAARRDAPRAAALRRAAGGTARLRSREAVPRYTAAVDFRLQRVVRVTSAAAHAAPGGAHRYWLTRPVEERLAAVEFLRRQHDGTGARLRRVLRLVDRPRR
jgi:hypothetical protein